MTDNVMPRIDTAKLTTDGGALLAPETYRAIIALVNAVREGDNVTALELARELSEELPPVTLLLWDAQVGAGIATELARYV